MAPSKRLPRRGVEVVEHQFTDSDAPLGGLALLRSGEGRAVLLPAGLAKLRGDALECAAELERTSVELVKLQRHLELVASEARSHGISWASIGWVTGLTGTGAQKRFGSDDE